MPIPSPIPLDACEHAVLTDPEVLGVFYFGSLGRGAATGGSDLDIYLWFSGDVPAPVDDKLRRLLGSFGEFHWLRLEEGRGFVGPAWTQVDFEVEPGDALDAPSDRFVGGCLGSQFHPHDGSIVVRRLYSRIQCRLRHRHAVQRRPDPSSAWYSQEWQNGDGRLARNGHSCSQPPAVPRFARQTVCLRLLRSSAKGTGGGF